MASITKSSIKSNSTDSANLNDAMHNLSICHQLSTNCHTTEAANLGDLNHVTTRLAVLLRNHFEIICEYFQIGIMGALPVLSILPTQHECEWELLQKVSKKAESLGLVCYSTQHHLKRCNRFLSLKRDNLYVTKSTHQCYIVSLHVLCTVHRLWLFSDIF